MNRTAAMATPNSHMKQLRPYQVSAIEAVHREWETHNSTLLVMATGTGKTFTATEILRERLSEGRVLWLAHRRELIQQARNTLEAALGVTCEVEMADDKATVSGLFGESQVVVASVQTMRGARLRRWPSDTFATIVADEAHHAVARGWRAAIGHFPNAKVLGLTATPDRLDGVGMGALFESHAFTYDLPTAVADGHLCPLSVRTVQCDDIRLDDVMVLRGQLVQSQLARIMSVDEVLHQVAAPLAELAGDRSTVVFCAGVDQAKALAEVLGGYGMRAEAVSGKTPDKIRRERLQAFANGELQCLTNVGVLTEGWDAPRTSCIALARPTKSRALLAQMVGRGTRLYPGKEECLVLDFVATTTKHTLATPTDFLYGDDVPPATKKRAKELMQQEGITSADALEQAEEEAEERERQAEAKRLRAQKLKAKVNFTSSYVDMLGTSRAPDDGTSVATPQQLARLARLKIKHPFGISKQRASELIAKANDRRKQGLCTFAQARVLARNGLRTDLSFAEAGAVITALAENGWRCPPSIAARYKSRV